MAYPTSSWDQYEALIRAAGERRDVDAVDAAFLTELGLLDSNGILSQLGQAYFDAAFINRDPQSVTLLMQKVLSDYRPAEAIAQRLFGVPNIDRSTVDSVLRNVGLEEGLNDRRLGTLLVTLDRFEIIRYLKNKGEVVVLIPPLDDGQVPATVFISRETPFSNVMWLGRVLKQCDGHICWLDKHFQASGLEALADIADGNRINQIQILSLRLPTNSTPKILKSYRALKTELAHRGITLEWRFIDSMLVRDSHDRWIIGAETAYNVPDVGTIMSGNKSEMSASASATRLNQDFQNYWSLGTEVA